MRTVEDHQDLLPTSHASRLDQNCQLPEDCHHLFGLVGSRTFDLGSALLGSCLVKKSFEAIGLQRPLSIVRFAQPRGSPRCIAHCEFLESGPALPYLFLLGLEIRCLAVTAANPGFLRLGRFDSAWPCRLT